MFPEGRILDFLIVGVVALIVVGPKDLPILMRRVGRFVAHMRGMAAEFRASFDEMARQSELDELRREVESMRAGQMMQTAAGFGAGSEASKVLEDIHGHLSGAPSTPIPADEAQDSVKLPPAETAGPSDHGLKAHS
jgi:sec-independent protein translocase protein TatB